MDRHRPCSVAMSSTATSSVPHAAPCHLRPTLPHVIRAPRCPMSLCSQGGNRFGSYAATLPLRASACRATMGSVLMWQCWRRTTNGWQNDPRPPQTMNEPQPWWMGDKRRMGDRWMMNGGWMVDGQIQPRPCLCLWRLGIVTTVRDRTPPPHLCYFRFNVHS